MSSVSIPLSKTKIVFGISGSVVFVAAGFWFLFYLAAHQTRFNPLTVKMAGIASILFFGLALVFWIKKYADKKPGLIIDGNGITDNASGVSGGLIEWKDITDIKTFQIMRTRLLLIYTADPEKYISRATGIKAKIMRTNLNTYGTPLSVASAALKTDFDKLEKIVLQEFEKHKC